MQDLVFGTWRLAKRLKNKILAITCSEITLTNNKSKYFMKLFHMLWKSLENRGILFKGTTAKITS